MSGGVVGVLVASRGDVAFVPEAVGLDTSEESFGWQRLGDGGDGGAC